LPMTVVVTVDVEPRFRGFLASCMLEVAPGVYTAPRMSRAVRQRVWDVISGWFDELGGGGVVMTWRDASFPGGQGLAFLGTPPKELHDADGIFLARRRLSPAFADVEGQGQNAKPT
jgi:CRISPR-associated protein Cas2